MISGNVTQHGKSLKDSEIALLIKRKKLLLQAGKFACYVLEKALNGSDMNKWQLGSKTTKVTSLSPGREEKKLFLNMKNLPVVSFEIQK